MEKKMMKSNGAGSRSSAMKRRRLFSAAAVLLAVCLVFVGAAGADVPNDLPTATVKILTDAEMIEEGLGDYNIFMYFKDNVGTGDVSNPYDDWIAEFILTANKTMTFNSSDTADGKLAGAYGSYQNGGLLPVPAKDVTLDANQPFPVVMRGMLEEGYASIWPAIPYALVRTMVGEFGCGIDISEAFLSNGPVKVTLELRLINIGSLDDDFWNSFKERTNLDGPSPSDDIMDWYLTTSDEIPDEIPYPNARALLTNMDLVLDKSENYLIGESYTFVVTQNGALREWDIEYEDEDGDTFLYEDEPNPSNYTVQSLPITLKTPVKEGYDFTGWKGEDGNLVTEISAGMTGNKKYVATWTIKKHTVTFETNDGSPIIPSKVEHNKKVLKPSNPTKEGYTFENWYSDSEFEEIYDFDIPVTNPLTLYANWTANKHTVTFDADEGTVSESTKEVTFDQLYGTLPTPTLEGYEFVGWYLDDTLITENIKVTVDEDHTLTALWKEIPDEENSAEGDVAPPSSGGGGDGGALSFPRFTENGGLVDFGSSKVVKAVLLPEGSRGSVLLKVDTVEKWPKALDTEYPFDISVEKLGDGMAYILFEIPVSTLDRLGITPADIGVYHLVDEVWVKLAVTYEVKDGTVFYEAETDSFSPFKLVIEEGAAVPKEEETVPVIPPTEEPDVPDEPEILPPIDEPTEPTEPETPAPILAVLAGLGAAVIVRRK